MSKVSGRVLVLDGMWNKSLAVVRTLAQRGLRVTAGECTRWSAALFSKYSSAQVIYPSPSTHPSAFLVALEQELETGRYDVVFPMEWSTQSLLTSPETRSRLERFVRIPFGDASVAALLNDKAFVMRKAESLGVAIPRTWHPSSVDEVRKVGRQASYPLLIKPRSSSGSRGILPAAGPQDLVDAYQRVHAQYPLPIIQEKIPSGGESLGVCVLLNAASEVRATFAYRKIRQYPVQGGPSTLRESIRNDGIAAVAARFLQSVKWTGIAHLEFMVDPRDGVPKLLEVNPRFWGSLALAIEAGVDFPYLLYRMAMDGDIAPVDGEYPAGVVCRWLLPGDLLHFIANPDRFRLTPGFFDFRAKDDILSLSDPLPVLGRVLSLFPLMFDPDMRKLISRRPQ